MFKLRHLICLLILHISIVSYTQKGVRIYIRAIDYESRHKLDQINILIYENDSVIDSLFGKTKDPVKFKLKPGKTYNVFIKKKGKVTRHLEYDLGNVTKKYYNEKIISKVVVSLFDEIKKVDYKFIKENPFAEYYFDTINKKLIFRYEQAEKMSNYVYNKFIHANEQAAQNEGIFTTAIRLADSLMKINEYSKALEYYTAASRIDNSAIYPQEQLDKINLTLKENAAKELEAYLSKQENDLLNKVIIKENVFKILDKKNDLKRNKVLTLNQLPEGLVFSVQIGAYRKIIPEYDYKKVKPVYLDISTTGLRRYIAGNFKTIEDAKKARLELINLGYKDAFLIVYLNKKRIKFDDIKFYE